MVRKSQSNLSRININTSDYSPDFDSQALVPMQEPFPTPPVAPEQGVFAIFDGWHGPSVVNAQRPIVSVLGHVNGTEFKLRRLIDGCVITAVDDGIKSPILYAASGVVDTTVGILLLCVVGAAAGCVAAAYTPRKRMARQNG